MLPYSNAWYTVFLRGNLFFSQTTRVQLAIVNFKSCIHQRCFVFYYLVVTEIWMGRIADDAVQPALLYRAHYDPLVHKIGPRHVTSRRTFCTALLLKPIPLWAVQVASPLLPPAGCATGRPRLLSGCPGTGEWPRMRIVCVRSRTPTPTRLSN